jgi:P-type Ca2+ transporter type 2C
MMHIDDLFVIRSGDQEYPEITRNQKRQKKPAMGFVVFSMLSVATGLSARSETRTAFNRDIFQDRNQMLLYGIALGMTFLATELGFLQKLLGTVSINGSQWFICIVAAFVLLLVDEVIKFFMRRRQQSKAKVAVQAPQLA